MTRREFFQRRIPRYRKDPLLFFKEVTHFEPDPWQREAAVAVSQHRRVAIRSGQGVGKTALEANLMWWFIACFSYPRIVCTAPTMQQLDNVLWAEMAKWLDASPVLQMMFTWTKTRVYMNGYDRRWFAVPRTATKPESLQGFHIGDNESGGVSIGETLYHQRLPAVLYKVPGVLDFDVLIGTDAENLQADNIPVDSRSKVVTDDGMVTIDA